jgi:hypothetical protein
VPRVTYSMNVSLDGYIVGPDGNFDWTATDDEVFRFVTDEIRDVGVQLASRRALGAGTGLTSRVRLTLRDRKGLGGYGPEQISIGVSVHLWAYSTL